jgi:MoaA/NifB/PqqE/SkfB family radical SAM enzyme
MWQYSLRNINTQLDYFNSIKEDYLYNFSLTLNSPLIGPFMLQLILTTRCNLRCKMCGVWKTYEEEIDTVYVKKAIDDAYKMGNLQQVYFTGGEVLLRPDIFRLIKYVKDHYPSVITHLNTNGLLLTRETINRLIDIAPTTLGVSIDSPDPKIHNSLRGEGVLEKVIEALDYINEQKEKRHTRFPMVNTLSILMDQTLETMPEMIDFAARYKFAGICIQPYVCNSDLRGETEDSFLIKKERLPVLREVLDKIEEKRKNAPLHVDIASDKIYNYFANPVYVDKCYSGFTRALIVGRKICFVCNGPNNEKRQHFGEADKDSIDSVWFSERAAFFRNTIKSCKKNCVQFCSIRPSSDSAVDINNRLKERKDLFLLFREISLLEECIVKYPGLPLKEIIESDYRLLFECLDILLTAIDLVLAGNGIDVDMRYLGSDLQKLSEYLRKEDSLYRVFIDEKLNGIDIENKKTEEKLSFYKRALQEYCCKKG